MAAEVFDRTWMWHPSFREERTDTAGLFVHFKKDISISGNPPTSLPIHVTADTRYKLYVNNHLVSFGPVKGDANLWFYDEIDIAQYLKSGQNHLHIIVLRFFFATRYATSFPRLPSGGLRVVVPEPFHNAYDLGSSSTWQTTIDQSTILRINEPEDDFLHIYEDVGLRGSISWEWVPAKLLEFRVATGNSSPWNLSPRQIPHMKLEKLSFSSVHNVQSILPPTAWESLPGCGVKLSQRDEGLCLPPGSTHSIDLEVPYHTTGFVSFRFTRPKTSGSTLHVTYSESYEEPPTLVPYLRRKEHRRDSTRALFGPQDIYRFQGAQGLEHHVEDEEESFMPFHFRTFRFLRVKIIVGSSKLILRDIEIEKANYPLNVSASFEVPTPEDISHKMWDVSIRTLKNCMHDCYEDCPFYEQLQYAMDTRSSALFTYYVSGDDRLARQAMTQIHNSFQARIGLTASRAPSHNLQIIPHFSLYWICMLKDHLTFFGDKEFLQPFTPVIDAVLNYFHTRLDPRLGLVVTDEQPGIWNFVDWVEEWRPYGIPPAATKWGISTYTNHLYAYTLKQAAYVLYALGRSSLAAEYETRAEQLVEAIRQYCFDGHFFTDSLTNVTMDGGGYSQHNQIWAVLSGAASQKAAPSLLYQTFSPKTGNKFVRTSISMSFYTLRALSMAGGTIYDDLFHQFWHPWASQIKLGLTTWEEDTVSQRSDCHAWGCAPIFEFMAEVAGIRPAGPGWTAITFQPRLCLYPELKASVPFCGSRSGARGVAHVSWSTSLSGSIKVSLRFEMEEPTKLPVYVKLPFQPTRVTDTAQDMTTTVDSIDDKTLHEENLELNKRRDICSVSPLTV
ncbi:bacterial alpha-L-rhamnosidase-domain-containing protein [Dactylonectria estremocensis]|uniref:Bacterial alpha-L-rhamnosidase-domain-containing protein n=1 Tax=Dactylonectria estremocensis TaxID=1079267 RepID=A0A9P9E0P0_9HYPO|nr:bacterial alpha-L-rhamnosidase-domain-containing protein [Dactylonectria estremocensis]